MSHFSELRFSIVNHTDYCISVFAYNIYESTNTVFKTLIAELLCFLYRETKLLNIKGIDGELAFELCNHVVSSSRIF